MRAARFFAAVDSHTEGMPTRVITGGVGPLPGATMLERKLHFEAELRRPAAAADARAARARRDVGRDPAAADARRRRLGRAVHRGLGLPADVRARDDRRRHRAGGDRHGRGAPSPRRSSGSTRRPGSSRCASRCEDGAARSVTLRNVPSFLHARDATVDVPGDRPRRLRPGVRRQLLRDRRRRRRSGSRSTRRARGELIDARRWRSWRRSRPPTARSTPRTRGSPAAPRHLQRARPRRRRRPRGDLDPPRLARPLAVRHRARPRGWRSCTRAASWRSATASCTSR